MGKSTMTISSLTLLLCTAFGLVGALEQIQMKGLEAFCTGVNCLSNPTLADSWDFTKDSNGDYTADGCNFLGIMCYTDANNATSVYSVDFGSSSIFSITPHIELTGTLASNLFTDINTLTNLNLRGNRLTGTIPVEMSVNTNLAFVDLGVNHFTGTIPEDLPAMTNLNSLDLSYNRLTGSIPDVGMLANLGVMKLNNNKLKGSLPPAIVQSSASMQVLWLQDNQLTGSLPMSSTGLMEFKVANNYLTGSIPQYSANLTYLDIAGNVGLDVAGCADNMASISRLSVSVADCSFPDSLVNPERTTLYLSSYLPEDSDKACPAWYTKYFGGPYCRINTVCPVSGTTIASWGAVKSGKLKQFGLLAGFSLNFTEEAVTALKVNTELSHLYLSATPHGSRFLHSTIYGGMLSAIKGAAWNYGTGQVLPSNIGDLSSLAVLVGAYLNTPMVMVNSTGDITGLVPMTNTLPVSMKKMTNLRYLSMPNPGVGAANVNELLTDPAGVLHALTPSLYALDIRGNQLNTSVTELFNQTIDSLPMKYLLLGDNDVQGGGFSETLLKMPDLEYFDISGNPTQESDFGDSKLALFTHTPNLKYWISSGTKLKGEFPAFPDTLREMEATNSAFTTGLGTTDFNLTHCRTFSLAGNNMTGGLPPANEFGYAMSYFIVRGNLIDGEVPTEYGSLPNLRWISVGRNRITGNVPSFGNGLQVLNIEQNKFSGSFFNAISLLSTLKQVSAYGNSFGGQWSDTIKANTELTKLNLASTGLTGPFPSLDSFAVLQSVHLGGNAFTGVVESCGLQDNAPPTAGTSSEEQISAGGGFFMLDIYGSEAISCYGLCWYKYPLTVLNRGDSTMMCSGTLPSTQMDALGAIKDAFGGMYAFTTWDLTKKDDGSYAVNPCTNSTDFPEVTCGANGDQWTITGLDLKYAFANATVHVPRIANFPTDLVASFPMILPNLTTLDMSNNYFSGKIPATGWSMSLEVLNLASNKLTGEVPWSSLGYLKALNVADNDLEGRIPDEAFTSFVELSASNNRLEGTIPEVTMGTVLPVSIMDLRGNLLSGTIPDSYVAAANCQSGVFNRFLMSSNNLEGTIPAGFGSHCLDMSLKRLMLDDNLLTGSVPSLNALSSLEVLTLQKNPLTGPLPSMDQMYGLVMLGIGLRADVPHVPYENFPGGANPLVFLLSTDSQDGAFPVDCIAKMSKNTVAVGFVGGFKGDVPQSVMDSLGSLTGLVWLALSDTIPAIGDFIPIKVPATKNHPNNDLTGILPTPASGVLGKVSVLATDGNDFTGPFPPAAIGTAELVDLSGHDNDYTVLADLKSYPKGSIMDIRNNPRIGAHGDIYFTDSFMGTSFNYVFADNCGFTGQLRAPDVSLFTGGHIAKLTLDANAFTCYDNENINSMFNVGPFQALAIIGPFYFNINNGAVPGCTGSLPPTPAPTPAAGPKPTPMAPTVSPTTGPTMSPTSKQGGGAGTSSSASGLGEGAVIGIAFGVFAFVVLAGALIYLYISNKSLFAQAQRASMRASVAQGAAQGDSGPVTNPMAPGAPARASYGGQVTSNDGRASSKEAPDTLTEL